MKVPYRWLAEFVDLDGIDAYKLAYDLSMRGTEVESVSLFEPPFSGVVVGKVVKIEKHPNADGLVVCKVDTGSDQRTIVCGARNFKENDLVPVALPGAVLGNTRIETRNIRGVLSEGMLCSERELGIGDDHSGIMVLDGGFEVGKDLASELEHQDHILDLEVTPNRPDCLSIYGIAREVAAIYRRELKKLDLEERSSALGMVASESPRVRLSVLDPEACPRYTLLVLDGVRVGKSPAKMRLRLAKCGIRSINNVVDATNYVMLELGQPMHAFDAQRISEGHVIVRLAQADEVIKTLDGQQRVLKEGYVVIADPAGPIALAGIMGGLGSEVEECTEVVALESANFNRTKVMRASRDLSLRTEASTRFEKGLDPNLTFPAAIRCALLISKMCGARIDPRYADFYPVPRAPWKVRLRTRRVWQVTGVEISEDRITNILRSLGLEAKVSDGTIEVTVPTYRADLVSEVDLIEEVARLYGFENFPAGLPCYSPHVGRLSAKQKAIETVRSCLAASGLYEVINYSFTSEAVLKKFGLEIPNEKLVRLLNPIIEEHSVLKPYLFIGLVENALTNFHRGIKDVFIYEIARSFEGVMSKDGLPRENLRLAVLMSGVFTASIVKDEEREADFFDLKGVLELIAATLGTGELKLEAHEYPFFDRRSSFDVVAGDERLGFCGKLSDSISDSYEFSSPGYCAELDLERWIEISKPVACFSEIAKFPPAKMDIAVVVDESVSHGDVVSAILASGGPYLEQVRLFDIYRGEQLGEGRKSLAYSLIFRSKERTLTDLEVKEHVRSIAKTLEERLGASIRGRV